MTDWFEVLIYFVAACIGIYKMTNVVNWLDQGTLTLPQVLAVLRTGGRVPRILPQARLMPQSPD